MNASELKYQVECANHNSHFFSRENMRFAGDTMRNYGVRKVSAVFALTYSGGKPTETQTREVWELYRRRAVKHGLRSSAYFDPDTFRQVFPID